MFIQLKSILMNSNKKKTSSSWKNEFHISRDLRKKYNFDESMFSFNGNVILADFKAVRKFVDTFNSNHAKHEHLRYGEVNAVGLMDEIYHYVLRMYEESENPGVFAKAHSFLNEKIGSDNLEKLLLEFTELFPAVDVYKGKITAKEYLQAETENRANTAITLEEIILLHITNINPAAKKLRKLFDENYFQNKELYKTVIHNLDEFFQTQKTFGPDNQDLFTFIKTPISTNPDNLWDQLEFIRVKWGVILKDYFTGRLLSSKDLMREDIKFESFGGGGGEPPTVAPVYKGKVPGADNLIIGKSMYKYADDIEKDYDEPEKFTKDIHWMPSVVLLAKNAYVWLDQLSKKYGREIKRLDQVPDEELDLIVRWNFTGLWLIGIWERSSASKRIKHIMGNIDAVASAYSLYDYKIAWDLGGEDAYNNLNERAKARGLRLASDMVPNHTGIHSDWVINNPDFFIQSSQPPFANYQFSGEDLSEDPHIQVRIEDGYYSHSDAAVVFQRIDSRTGEVRYIYHGNDGTSMPWNDTAQLDMLKKEVREAVIQKIFDVARKFSIIRFDAAMTLTKRHFSRLWYPQPGMGGDIPSRSDHALTKQQFDELFPEEFWREVVDRINSEMPETLLLAEAFWLMEGYFVRSLGMHRVYNSAFMHMMMKEENDKYRDLITNTLEFEPEILKRYVNFMSNPDEETAIRQFGTDDKYFGVLVLMVTLPGLPMFAHGQIEGFTEKYGMEYQRAYYNENPKDWLIDRHEREIFPLTSRRYLFAEVENFWFYDCIDEYGNINENVFAFTNSFENEKALVLFNNKYETAYGKINVSTPKLVSDGKGNKTPKSITIFEALGINGEENYFYKLRDNITRLEYLVKGADMITGGYYVHLEGFKYQVLSGFKEIYDETGNYEELYHKLHGQGVASIKEAVDEIKLAPVHEAFENMFRSKDIAELTDYLISDIDEERDIADELKIISEKYNSVVEELSKVVRNSAKHSNALQSFSKTLEQVKNINLALILNFSPASHVEYTELNRSIVISEEANYKENFLVLLNFITLIELHNLFNGKEDKESVIDTTLLLSPVKNIMKRLGRGEEGVNRELLLINILLNFGDKLFDVSKGPKKIFEIKTKKDVIDFVANLKGSLVERLLNSDLVKSFLLVNEYKEVVYFSKERFEELTDWLLSTALLRYHVSLQKNIATPEEEGTEKDEKPEGLVREHEGQIVRFITNLNSVNNYIKECSDKSEYKLEKLKNILLQN